MHLVGMRLAACGTRLYAGTSDGMLRCYQRKANQLSLDLPIWSVRAAYSAILCICAIPDSRGQRHSGTSVEPKGLIVVGSADGYVIVFRGRVEVRSFRLDNSILHICHQTEQEFAIVDDSCSVYGITPYEIQWRSKLQQNPSVNLVETTFFSSTAAPIPFQGMASVRLLDIEQTVSSYTLVAYQNTLLITHHGTVYAVIPMKSAVSAVTNCRVHVSTTGNTTAEGKKPDTELEDFILVTTVDGSIFRLVTTRTIDEKNEPTFNCKFCEWSRVSFPIMKLVILTSKVMQEDILTMQWSCLGLNGEIAHFRGQELVSKSDMNSQSQAQVIDIAAIGDSSGTSLLVAACKERVNFLHTFKPHESPMDEV